MKILDRVISLDDFNQIEDEIYFSDMNMVKAVVDIDSLINPPRNREAGYPRVGRGVADPKAREKIVEVVKKWIEL